MIEGTSPASVPYVPEEERGVTEKQTVFWIKPKTGHDSNQSLSVYAACGKDNSRTGFRELSVRKLDSADVSQWVQLVERVEWYMFSERFPDLRAQGPFESITDEGTISKVALDISSDLLIEVFEASNNAQRLLAGQKKESTSQSTSPSGKASA